MGRAGGRAHDLWLAKPTARMILEKLKIGTVAGILKGHVKS